MPKEQITYAKKMNHKFRAREKIMTARENKFRQSGTRT
jgi:hypothetical protein